MSALAAAQAAERIARGGRVEAADAMAGSYGERAEGHTLITDGGELDWLIDEAKQAIAAYHATVTS